MLAVSSIGLLLLHVLYYFESVNAQPSTNTTVLNLKGAGNLTQQILTKLLLDSNSTNGNVTKILELEKKNNPSLDMNAINNTVKSFGNIDTSKIPLLLPSHRPSSGEVIGWGAAGGVVGSTVADGPGAVVGTLVGAIGCALGIFC